MIRYRLRELIADRSFRLGKTVTVTEISNETGIARRVLTSISNERGYNTGIENIDKLCRYFGCQVGELLVYVDDASIELAKIDAKPPVGRRSKRGK